MHPIIKNASTIQPTLQPKSLYHFLNNNGLSLESVKVLAYSPVTDFKDSTSGQAVIESGGSAYLSYLTAVQNIDELHITHNTLAKLDAAFFHPQFMALEDKQKWACLSALASQAPALQDATPLHFEALLHMLSYVAHNTTDDGTDVYDAARSYAHGATAIDLPEDVVVCAALDYSHAMLYSPDAPEHGIYVKQGDNFTEVVALSEYETLLKLSDGTYMPSSCAKLFENGFLSPFNDCLRVMPEFPAHEAYGETFTLSEEQQQIIGDFEQLLAPEYSVTRDGDAYVICMYADVESLDLADHFFLADS